MTRFFGLLAFTVAFYGASLVIAQDAGKEPAQKETQPPKGIKGKTGLQLKDPSAFQGYTLFSPLGSLTSYLIDMEGRLVRSWEGASGPQLCAYLLPNGNLLRPCVKDKDGPSGTGGRIQEFTWDGQIVWDYTFPDDKYRAHHDMTKLPNGNLLVVVYERKTADQGAAVGRKGGALLEADAILEIRPKGKDGGEIVWEWHVWDHLIQDHDGTKANFGKVAEHPELVDVNLGGLAAKLTSKDKKGGVIPGGNWTHINAVAYHAELDQIMLSVHEFSELWIIDHATTAVEAAGHKGGKRDKGGDLLYRWGNPQTYRAGKAADRRLFAQHNAHWIPKGLPGAGNVLIFNNGMGRSDGTYSTVDEVALPVDAKGFYSRPEGAAFGPEKAHWSYVAPKKTDFYSAIISGAHRLPNGNTFICSGTNGTIFEVTAKGEMVWKYVNPIKGGPLATNSWMFRAYRYGADDPALKGRTLSAGKTIEEMLQKEKGK